MPSSSQMTFAEYLAKYGRLSEEMQAQIVSLVELRMGAFLRQWVSPDFGDVWDEAYDHNFYEQARNSVLGNQECRNTLGEEFTIYNQTLKHLAHYLEWQKQQSGIGSTGKKRGKRQATALPSVVPLTEGELKEMHAVHRERNPEVRAACILHYRNLHGGRLLCECCGFDFGKFYGDLGDGFIEVHHLNPISQQDEAHAVDPTTDVVPLCANCHAMIHRLLARANCEGMESLQQLEAMISQED